MKALRLVLITLSLLGLLAALSGCGGASGEPVFLNIDRRASWEQITNGLITMTAYGGNGLLYIYDIGDTGGNPVLLTPSLNNIYDLEEGGQDPVYNPPLNLTTQSTTICMASRRSLSGNTGASLALYTMSATTGDVPTGNTPGLVRITDDNSTGTDTEPNYSPDGTKIIYSSTRGTGVGQIRVANANGSSTSFPNLFTDSYDDEWPCYNPKNADQIVFQSTRGEPAGTTTQSNIFTYTISTKTFTKITAASLAKFANGAPCWSPDGTTIAFHSNPGGNYNIFTLRLADGKLVNVTNDARSDGFPVWDPTNTFLAFTRDRELWIAAANGVTLTSSGQTQQQLTRRF